MVKKGIVKKIIKGDDFYAPHIVTNKGSCAGLPEELSSEVEIGDEVIIFSNHSHLVYGGFSAVVIETPRASLSSTDCER